MEQFLRAMRQLFTVTLVHVKKKVKFFVQSTGNCFIFWVLTAVAANITGFWDVTQ
jgi:hypothetical protein